MYNQEYSTQQGSHSDLIDKSFPDKKIKENSAEPNQVYNNYWMNFLVRKEKDTTRKKKITNVKAHGKSKYKINVGNCPLTNISKLASMRRGEDKCGTLKMHLKFRGQQSETILHTYSVTCFYNIFLASLLKTPSCPALLYPIFLLEKQSQWW